MAKPPNQHVEGELAELDDEFFKELGGDLALAEEMRSEIRHLIQAVTIRCRESRTERMYSAERRQRIVARAEELRSEIAMCEPGDLIINFQFRDAPMIAEYLCNELKVGVPVGDVINDQNYRQHWVIHLIYGLAAVFSEVGGTVKFNRIGTTPFARFVRKVQTKLPEVVKARPGRKCDEDYLWATAWRKRDEIQARLSLDPLGTDGLQNLRHSQMNYKKRKEDLIRALGGEVPSRPKSQQAP